MPRELAVINFTAPINNPICSAHNNFLKGFHTHMSNKKRLNVLLFVFALAIGVAIFVLLMRSRTPPSRESLVEHSRSVRVIQAPKVAVVPRAIGYGSVQPGITWEAVSQVGGTIVAMHPDLDVGGIIPKDALLFRIDPEEYGLATTKGEADVADLRARITELEQRQHNYERILEIERRSLEISAKELQRKRQLVEKGTISKSEVDQQEQKFLSQKNAVQNLENSLNLLPAERESLEAQLESGRSQLAGTRLDVGRTEIRAPFTLRIEKLNVELHEYAPPGSVLAQAYDIAAAEIPAQMPLAAMRRVVSGKGFKQMAAQNKFSMDDLRTMLGLKAVVRLPLGDDTLEWQARFSRMGEEIDPQTRTVPVYVVVDDPYVQAIPGERPPLLKNMYCQVELQGQPRPAEVVIPRIALRQGNVVYVVNNASRLELRNVKPGYAQGSIVAIEEGLAPDEQVVISDLEPAIAGQLLLPQLDPALREAVIAEATAEAPLQ